MIGNACCRTLDPPDQTTASSGAVDVGEADDFALDAKVRNQERDRNSFRANRTSGIGRKTTFAETPFNERF